MYTLNTNIVIDQPGQTIEFPAAVGVHIRKSMHSMVDTAVIRLPLTCRLQRNDGETITPSTDTAKVFNRGDKIEIFAGHDGELVSEFKGFIKQPNYTDPLELQLEGYAFQLRKKAPVKSWQSVQLKELLGVLIEGTDITIHPDTPDTTIAPYYIGTKGEDALDVLEDLKKTRILSVYFINGNQLYVGPDELAQRDKVVYHDLGWNTFDDTRLRYRNAEDVKCHISISYMDAKGKRHHTTVGEKGGIERSYVFDHPMTAEEAKRLALLKGDEFLYEGYEGAIKTLAVPYCAPGFKSVVTDRAYKDREGSFIVESTQLILEPAPRGDERIVELGKKVNRQR